MVTGPYVHSGKPCVGAVAQHHGPRLRWSVLPAAWLLAACLLAVSSADAAQNPFNVTDTGSIGASAEPLLPPLSTFVPSLTLPQSEVLGTTAFRYVRRMENSTLRSTYVRLYIKARAGFVPSAS